MFQMHVRHPGTRIDCKRVQEIVNEVLKGEFLAKTIDGKRGLHPTVIDMTGSTTNGVKKFLPSF
jgi:hypothetical protein